MAAIGSGHLGGRGCTIRPMLYAGISAQPVRDKVPLCQSASLLASVKNSGPPLRGTGVAQRSRGVRSHFSGEQRTCQAFVLAFLASSAPVRRSFSLFWRAAHLSGVRSHFSGEQRTCQAFALTFLASSAPAKARSSVFSGNRRTRRPGRAAHPLQSLWRPCDFRDIL